MKLSDMYTLLGTYVDDVVTPTTATQLLNAGQNKMAVDAKAVFPQLSDSTPEGTFIFPEKYHEIPVLYAAAMVKAQDSSIREKGSYLDQFYSGMRDFTENYDIPMQYRDEQFIQQFTATLNQTDFLVTKDTFINSNLSGLKVYVNNRLVDFTTSAEYIPTYTFRLKTASSAGDAVTAVWETHHEYDQPPMPWWTW